MSYKYSTLLNSKIPEFIRDDPAYSKFINFFDVYYQWFDETYDIYGLGDKLDIDYGFADFQSYFAADFLPNFPDIDTIAADKVKLLKIVRALYTAKGIPDSFKFLFRALYNTSVEVTPTRDFVLRASDGKWIVPKSIKIKSLDPNFLKIDNLRIFGESSKAIGIVEKSVINGKFTQIYLSGIERLFSSAETITVKDNENKTVYFLNGKKVDYEKTPPDGSVSLSSKIIGALSDVTIESTRRGKYYKVGDPVVFEGGFASTTVDPVGANAYISEVTTGQIQKVIVTDGGYGYRLYPNSTIDVIKSDGTTDNVALCIVSLVDESKPANITFISTDCIVDNYNVVIGSNSYNFSVSANANTQLKNCFSFLEYTTYPITAITVRNGGGGYEQPPTLDIHSSFNANTANSYRQDIDDLGILSPIEIIDGGDSYTTLDTITISGGDGSLALAKIDSVDANGKITAVSYYYDTTNPYSTGGMGYLLNNLPTVTVNSTAGANANLVIPGILGTGAKYTLETDKIGAITKITLNENGEDYIATPNVSLRVQDIVVTGTTVESIIPKVSFVYQGNIQYPSFYAKVSSVKSIYFNPLTNDQVFSVRLFDYKGSINSEQQCHVYSTDLSQIVSELTLQSNYNVYPYTNGILLYGDGSAKANAHFLNGLIEDAGRYLNSDGQLSAHSVLQNDMYNSSSYILSTEKDYDLYKNAVKSLVHPIGTNIITRNLLKSQTAFSITSTSAIEKGDKLLDASSLLIQNSTNFSNTVLIYYANDIDEILSIGDKISIKCNTGFNIYSTIQSLNVIDSYITLDDHVQYKFPNVYNGYTNANSIVITTNNYTDNKYWLNNFINITDVIIMGDNNYEIENIVNNTLYFPVSLDPVGTEINTANVTIIKNLTANNITTYTTV